MQTTRRLWSASERSSLKPRRESAAPPTEARRSYGVVQVCLVSALYLTLASNLSLWKALIGSLSASPSDLLLLVGLVLGVAALVNILLVLLSARWMLKPALIILFVLASLCASFMDGYGVVIDRGTIHDVLDTDLAEASELVTPHLLLYVILLGGLPAVALVRTTVTFPGGWRGVGSRGLVVLGSAVVLLVLVAGQFKELVILGRQHRELRMLVNPVYPIYATISALSQRGPEPSSLSPIALDASRPTFVGSRRRRVLVFVVGETARSASFSINGYARETTPRLSRLPIVSFTDAHACGTSTSISVPCMFARLGQATFDRKRARAEENVLDVLDRTGVSVRWRDNDSGCKGVCSRIPTTEFSARSGPSRHCEQGECVDEVLLEGLEQVLLDAPGDTLVVLHTKGSHGPAYHERVPEQYKRFLPECVELSVHSCDRQALVNAYDNTIAYTDHVLAEVIALLERNRGDLAGGMLYVSDHGESLGEHGIYLHGMPTLIAPLEQTQVPFLMWMSPELERDLDLDPECLARRSQEPVSHDNIFDSLLGLFDVRTRVYDPDLDVLARCRGRARGQWVRAEGLRE